MKNNKSKIDKIIEELKSMAGECRIKGYPNEVKGCIILLQAAMMLEELDYDFKIGLTSYKGEL